MSEETVAEKGARTARWKLRGILTCTIIGGGLFVFLADHIPVDWAKVIIRDIGSAFIVSGVLGLTVDTFFKGQFARDAFLAAYRYVLRPELRDEVTRIINYTLMSTKHKTIIVITSASSGFVKVHFSIERDITNITNKTLPVKNLLQLDEWGAPGHKSTIEKCTLIIDGRPPIEGNDMKEADRPDRIGKETTEISLGANKTAKLVSIGYEFHHDNGEFYIGYRDPTIEPTVTVEAPNHEVIFGFGVPDEQKEQSAIRQEYTLKGTQFPGQSTRVRWWPKDAAS